MKRGFNLYALLLISFYAVIGFWVFPDFGISWDESFQHEYGKVSYEYIFGESEALLEHDSRYHGPIFQLMLYSAEKLSGFNQTHQVFLLRHFLTFLLSVVGITFFYRLLIELKFSQFWSTVGVLFFISAPRIFAHSFYNSKDAVFMYLFVISMFTMLRFLKRSGIGTALAHALSCALLIDVRILGFFIPAFTALLWLLQVIKSREKFLSDVTFMALFGAATLVLVVAFWPTLWHSPIAEFQNAITRMTAYPWDDPILFECEFKTPKELPRYYLLKWMLISTPLFLTAFALVGVLFWMFGHQRDTIKKLALCLWLVVPLAVVILKDATVYDSWRHLFFLFPAIVVLAVVGAQALVAFFPSWKWVRLVPVALTLFPITWMIKNHPHHQVYFNSLVRQNAWSCYEMDYWGLSYSSAYDWLIEEIPEGRIDVAVANGPGFFNTWGLSEYDKERIKLMPADSADFFISNFRYPNEHNAAIRLEGVYSHPIWMLSVDGNRMCGIFRLDRNSN